jgi:hypothetical protein
LCSERPDMKNLHLYTFILGGWGTIINGRTICAYVILNLPSHFRIRISKCGMIREDGEDTYFLHNYSHTVNYGITLVRGNPCKPVCVYNLNNVKIHDNEDSMMITVPRYIL